MLRAYFLSMMSAMPAEEHASGLQGYLLTVELLSGTFELMENRLWVYINYAE